MLHSMEKQLTNYRIEVIRMDGVFIIISFIVFSALLVAWLILPSQQSST